MGKKRLERSAAILTILDGANMTPKGKCDIARWLRRQARFLTMHGYEMSNRYTARYIYSPATDLRHSRKERLRISRKSAKAQV
jgi:hypothetical protein